VREITGASNRRSRRAARAYFRFHRVPPKKGICIVLGHLNADSLRECSAATHIVGLGKPIAMNYPALFHGISARGACGEGSDSRSRSAIS
jgi:hypothetical protein